MNFRCYIPYARNPIALNKAVDSVLLEINQHSTYPEKKVVVINDSEQPVEIFNKSSVDLFELPHILKMSHAQQCNWMIKDALETKQPFCMSTHADSVLNPGAMKDILAKYEEVKDTNWGMIFSGHGGHIFSLMNPRFFVEENVWYDPFLFPFYYMDNHMYRIMVLRGWTLHTTDSPIQLVDHISSHYLKEDPIFRRKNDIAFNAHGLTYRMIWGGLPGEETNNDPYASGTLTRN